MSEHAGFAGEFAGAVGISDAVVTENFSGSCWSSFLLVPNYPKQELKATYDISFIV